MVNIKEFLPNKQNAKWWLLGGAGAAGFYIYEKRKTATEPISSSDTTTADVGTTSSDLGYDPSQYDLSSDYTGYSGGSIGGYYNSSGYGYTGSTSPVSALPTTDEEWSVDAVTLLGNQGYDQAAAGLAVAQYLLKHQLTQDQANMVSVAISQLNYPPQAGALPISVKPSSGQTPSTPAKLPKVSNGYYRDVLNGNIWLVQDEMRHLITPTSWKQLERTTKPKLSPITPVSNYNVLKLPRGNNI